MFIEPNFMGENRGWIEVICGSMFSGKTEELIRRLKRVEIAKRQVKNFKPAADNRYQEHEKIVSHDHNKITSIPIQRSRNILKYAMEMEVVGIDEAQFFDEQLPDVCRQLALSGVRVIVAGLDMDYKGRPYGPMPNLLAIADYVTKLHAICVVCGNIANVSYRKVKKEEQFLLGERDSYEARCRHCARLGDQVKAKGS